MDVFAQVPVTALYGGLNALLAVLLGLNVSLTRGREKVNFGSGDSIKMQQAIRVHQNNVEYVPLAITLLLILEIMGAASLWIHIYGGALFVARLSHAHGLMTSTEATPTRFIGALSTFILIIAASIGCIAMGWSG